MTDSSKPRDWWRPAPTSAITVMGVDVGAEPSRQSWAVVRYNADGSVEIVATGEGDPPLSLSL